ncbi:hypothetical protein [Halosimplex amylolyticum]|uniref:hypothetical protein n=1 Tax=Halosimplex amylolyticum TaxID=3396616 RepID=UPI003F552B07
MKRTRIGRRSFLGGVTASLAGLSGCNNFGSDATDSGTPTGTPTESTTPQDTPRSPSDEPPTPSDPTVKKTLDGLVVPVAPELEPADAIDPNQTETPVGDAVAKIDETGENEGFGTVLLPPFKVQEAEPIVPSQFVEFVGWGVHTSEIEFTDLERDGFRITHLKDGKFVSLDGFTVSGLDKGDRSGGSAIHFVNDTGVSPKQFNIGNLAFRNWIDPVVHCEQGSPFDSVWGHLDFGYDANDGREIVLEKGQSLLGVQIGYIGAGNATGDPVFYTDFAGAKVDIGFINVGGSAGQAVRIKAAKNGHVRVGGINFEPVRTTEDPIVAIQGQASTRLEYVQNTNSDVRSMVQLQHANGNNVIGPLLDNGTVRVGKIEVTSDAARPSYYFGPSSDVVHSESDVSGGVRAFGDSSWASGETIDRSASSGVAHYSNASPSDLAAAEFAVDVDVDGTGSTALLFKDGDGTVHRWDAQPSDQSG